MPVPRLGFSWLRDSALTEISAWNECNSSKGGARKCLPERSGGSVCVSVQRERRSTDLLLLALGGRGCVGAHLAAQSSFLSENCIR